jgi:AcrR family transcriptional regulator
MQIRKERKDAANHRQLILKTAEALFQQHGVGAVSMHQIAKTAGIGQGTLYRRYAHKGDLCCELINDYFRLLIERTNAYLEESKNIVPPEERLGTLLDQWIDIIESKSEWIMAMESQVTQTCDQISAFFFQSPIYRYARDKFSELLAEMAEKSPDRPIHPVITAHAIICSLDPPGYFHLKQEMGYTVDDMKQAYRRMFFGT